LIGENFLKPLPILRSQRQKASTTTLAPKKPWTKFATPAPNAFTSKAKTTPQHLLNWCEPLSVATFFSLPLASAHSFAIEFFFSTPLKHDAKKVPTSVIITTRADAFNTRARFRPAARQFSCIHF